MAYVRDRVIVLRCDPFREHDAWITAFGEEQGKLMAVARGYFRRGAKQLGHLEPLQCVEVMIAKGNAFDKLAVAKTVESAQALRASLPGLALVGAIAALVEELTRPGIAERDVFALLHELALSPFPEEAMVSSGRVRFLYGACGLRLLDHLGYRPQLDSCVMCDAITAESWWISAAAGGVVCGACAPSRRWEDTSLRPLSMSAFKVLRFLRRSTLMEILALTASREIFQEVSEVIESLLARLPVSRALHGPETIRSLV